MVRTLRLLFFGLACAGLVGLGTRALALGRGEEGAWEAARMLLAEVRRSEALDARDEASRRCNQGKAAVTAEVIAGRLSLAEAAERFARHGALLEGNAAGVGAYRGPAGEQAVCRNVITWASAALPTGSSQRAAVLARLEAEYQALFTPDGPGPGAPA
jgi:hypothetical protein